MRQPGTADSRGVGADADAPLALAGSRSVRPVTGPFDLRLVPAPDGGLAEPSAPGVSLSADQLADLVVRAGGAGCDLRVVIPDGARYLTLLSALAQRLGRDVLVAPAGAELSSPTVDVCDGPDETVPIDRASGSPVDWLLIQPPDRATSLPGWFDLVAGLVLPRSGPVFLPLASGLMLATRDDFVDRRHAAVQLAAGHPGLVTVAVSVRDGGFVIGDYTGAEKVYSGQGAAVVLASLPLYGGDLRVWLSWPQPRVERDRLRANLVELANTTGATVWVPQEGGQIVLEPASRDLAAHTDGGEVSQWLAYPPDGVGGAYDFESDVDGRLVPVGALVTEGYPGVPLVSVPAARAGAMVDWYPRVLPAPGRFLVDLAVLDDGRLAARCTDGNLLALGPRRLSALLRDAGWQGEDVVLAAPVPPERLAGLGRYAADLDFGFWVAQPGGRVLLEEGQPRVRDVAGEPGGWQYVGPSADTRWRSSAGWLVPVLVAEPRVPAGSPEPRVPLSIPEPRQPAPVRQVAAPEPAVVRDTATVTDAATRQDAPEQAPASAAPTTPDSAAPAWSTVDEIWSRASQSLRQHETANLPALVHGASAELTPVEKLPAPLVGAAAPRLVAAARSSKPHGVSWLSAQPLVNAEPIDLYVPSRWDPERVRRDGVPCPDLFVMGRLDPVRLASEQQGGYLLRVRIDPGGGVDVSASEASPPPDLHLALAPTDAYLLPVGWLDRTRLIGGYAVTGDGELSRSTTLDGSPLLLHCADARHGVAGLPNNVTRWPQLRLRNATSAYGLIPEQSNEPVGDWVELHRRRPPVLAGRRLVQLRVENGRAIDVADSARQLAPLTSMRSRVVELRTAGVELLVPRRSYERVTVKRLFVPDGKRWRRRADVVDLPLSALVRAFD